MLCSWALLPIGMSLRLLPQNLNANQQNLERFDSREIAFSIQSLSGTEFKTPFFHDLMSELRAHPQYVADLKDADIIFVDYDSLRQCIYPKLNPHCVNVQAYPKESELLYSQEAEMDPDEFMAQYSVEDSGEEWRANPQIFIDAVKKIRDQITDSQVLIYFANVNSWSDGPNHKDIKAIRQMQAQLGVRVFLVGLDLVSSSMDHAMAVSVLMPLLPTGQFYELGHAAHDVSETLCNQRPILASFIGSIQRTANLRRNILALHNESSGIICKNSRGWGQDGGMKQMLSNSTFGFAPRGDAHYSFRLTEILAAGAVPVLIDDEAMPPYGADSFHTWAVVIRENEIFKAPEILQSLDKDTICRMQKEGRKILTYSRDMKGTADGMVAALKSKLLKG